jgi:large subunit ribosomal protein L20
MPRVKRGKNHLKKRRKILKAVKGYRGGRKNKIKLAKTAIKKAGVYAYRDRRNKKRTMRQLWQIKINALSREHGLSYNIELDRKILAQIAEQYPHIYATIIEKVR